MSHSTSSEDEIRQIALARSLELAKTIYPDGPAGKELTPELVVEGAETFLAFLDPKPVVSAAKPPIEITIDISATSLSQEDIDAIIYLSDKARSLNN